MANGTLAVGYLVVSNKVQKSIFLVKVPDWQTEMIVLYVQLGCHIVSDGLAAYAGTEEINHGIYS